MDLAKAATNRLARSARARESVVRRDVDQIEKDGTKETAVQRVIEGRRGARMDHHARVDEMNVDLEKVAPADLAVPAKREEAQMGLDARVDQKVTDKDHLEIARGWARDVQVLRVKVAPARAGLSTMDIVLHSDRTVIDQVL